MDWTTEFDPWQKQRIWTQTDSGAHPASCKMGTGGPFPGPGLPTDHSPPSSAEVKKE
jgi:hypothetical protein